MTSLKALLDALVAEVDVHRRLARDPIRVPRRYDAPPDVEIAALVSALLAFGRVEAFLRVLDGIFAVADRAGGPHAFVLGFDPARDAPALAPFGHRWVRGPDVALLFAALQRVIQVHGGLQPVFAAPDAAAAIDRAATHLAEAALAAAPALGLPATTPTDLPRGFRHLVPSPRRGSACKRWNLLLRWMIRPADGVDLGLWDVLSPSDLVIPLDRHIQRIAPLLGLVDRADGSWKSAVAITDALRAFHPADPVRYDFALAHLGISDGCRGRFEPEVCPTCPVRPVCRHGRASPR